MVQYASHKYPCLDQYPEGQEFVSNDQIARVARQQVAKQQSLKGAKLSASAVKKQSRQTFKKLKAAFKVSSIWDPVIHPDITVAFLDGTVKQRDWVKKVVNEKLAPICHRLNFVWDVPVAEANLRISFALSGQAWSYVGTDNLEIPLGQATMNLGWLDDDTQYDSELYKNTGQVVLHEFCHALGMIHEHQNPKGNPIKWNKDVVYDELQRTNNWGPADVDHNMFKKYGDAEMCEKVKNAEPYVDQDLDIEGYCMGEEVNGSKYDLYSIMHYFYPATWISEGPTEIPVNTELSVLDKIWLGNYYGTPSNSASDVEVIDKEELEDEILIEEETDDEDEPSVAVERIEPVVGFFIYNNVNKDLVAIIVLLILAYIIVYYVLGSTKKPIN